MNFKVSFFAKCKEKVLTITNTRMRKIPNTYCPFNKLLQNSNKNFINKDERVFTAHANTLTHLETHLESKCKVV